MIMKSRTNRNRSYVKPILNGRKNKKQPINKKLKGRERVKKEYFPKNPDDAILDNFFPISVIKLDVNRVILCSSRDDLINWIYDRDRNIVTEINTSGFVFERELEEENKLLYFNKTNRMRRLYDIEGNRIIPDYKARSKSSTKFDNPTQVFKLESFNNYNWHRTNYGNGRKH